MNKEDLKKKLSPEAYNVTQEKGTEASFSGEYDQVFAPGKYNCIVCGAQLFASDNKYDAGCGWPSFDQALPGAVKQIPDNSHDMQRTEVTCAKCGAHLGHVFEDGPQETTGQRFCINSVALHLEKEKTNE